MNPPEATSADAEYTHLGAYLKSLREHYELDVAQTAARLHIRPKYIEAIEAGDMSALPDKVYTQGYIHSYAEFLGLDAASVMAQYDGLGSAAPKAQPFRLIEPTQQSGVPAGRLICLVAVALLVLYGLIQWLGSGSQEAPQSRIDAVPERLQEKVRAPLIITPRNAQCVRLTPSASRLPCYYIGDDAAQTPPLKSIMELAR
jgi:cytoskeletal protein RodZ